MSKIHVEDNYAPGVIYDTIPLHVRHAWRVRNWKGDGREPPASCAEGGDEPIHGRADAEAVASAIERAHHCAVEHLSSHIGDAVSETLGAKTDA